MVVAWLLACREHPQLRGGARGAVEVGCCPARGGGAGGGREGR
jgi:hypothetical protein